MNRVEETREIMAQRFIPNLHKILGRSNPNQWIYWQGNCCRQTAIFGATALTELMPEYQWTVWEGKFTDSDFEHLGEFEHAWIYGEMPHTKMGLLVDLARIHKPNLFIEVEKNEYPFWVPEYRTQKEISRVELDWVSLMEETEFYTQVKGVHVGYFLHILMVASGGIKDMSSSDKNGVFPVVTNQ